MITGRILRTEETPDGRRNIAIVIEFSEDGKVIVPEWPLWARFENLIGMTQQEISEWIRINVESQIGNLIRAKTKAGINSVLMETIENLKSITYQADKVNIAVPESQVTTGYIVVLNADGTYTVVK